MSKSFLTLLVFALTLLACSLGLQAASDTASTPAPTKVFGVTLTAAQAVQFQTIYAAEKPAMQAIRDNAALSEADKRTQMTAIYAKIKQQLKAILTPEQIAQMEQTPATPAPTPVKVKVFGVTLTSAQAVQFKAICAAQQPAEKAIRDNTTLSASEKQTQMAAIYATIKEQLKAILTPEQIAQMGQATPAPPTTTPVKVYGVTLTPAQAVKFKAICDAQQPAQQAIRNNSTLSAADKQTQMSAIYATIKVQLKAILTPAQIAQMAQASTTTTSTTPIKVFGVTLTPAEAVQFKAIYSAQLPAKKAIRDNTTLSKAEKQTMMTEIYTSLREQLKAILTPEQIAQMEQTPPQTTKK